MPNDLVDFFVAIGQYASLRATSAYMMKATTLHEQSNELITEFGEDFTALEQSAALSILAEADRARRIAQQPNPRRRDACKYARRAKTAQEMIRAFSERVQAGRLYRSWPGQTVDGQIEEPESDVSSTQESLAVTGEADDCLPQPIPSHSSPMARPECCQTPNVPSPASPHPSKRSSRESRRRVSSSSAMPSPTPQNALVLFSPQRDQLSLHPQSSAHTRKSAFEEYVAETRHAYLPHPPAGFYLGDIPHTNSPIWTLTTESHVPFSYTDPNAPMHWVRSDGVSTVFYA